MEKYWIAVVGVLDGGCILILFYVSGCRTVFWVSVYHFNSEGLEI